MTDSFQLGGLPFDRYCAQHKYLYASLKELQHMDGDILTFHCNSHEFQVKIPETILKEIRIVIRASPDYLIFRVDSPIEFLAKELAWTPNRNPRQAFAWVVVGHKRLPATVLPVITLF